MVKGIGSGWLGDSGINDLIHTLFHITRLYYCFLLSWSIVSKALVNNIVAAVSFHSLLNSGGF